ncbi:hypothetical protein H2198_008751 [Neophaeococcomyces mojaviensis]|uniref:Uncharacterized protein n=1 Tax=Neophaeococcomyces mojaviensis TaxID=3383035 RepID=A0ACC2ZWD8_9EURO|nr:hypothetical protein H2198_008751 [Knufia sp. JES_112]
MSNLSFVIVQPGKKHTPASKHEARVGIHSHAQRVTQQRKRERKWQEQEKKVKAAGTTAISKPTVNDGIIRRLDGSHDINALIQAVGSRKYQYGIPTPSPEPDFDRPFTSYSSWTEDQRYGLSMFQHVTILDINDIATNMTFWKSVAPAYGEIYPCVRDIISAIACANQAIQNRDDKLILTAFDLHLRAIAGLRQDLMSLPLSAQVACCLLFDAFNVLRCDFVQAGTQIATAKRLTQTVSVDAYLEDEKLAEVCEALDRISQSSAWSLWNPSNFLRFEGLRHAEPNLYIELQPIDCSEGRLKGLVSSMERLSRHFSGRIRRNLSDAACLDPSSRLARDVLSEFQIWKAKFDAYIATQSQLHSPDERATVQQAEIAWNFTYITFTAGVLDYGELVYDDSKYFQHYNRINELAEQRFSESASYSKNVPIKAFLQIIVPTLWLTILMCRDPQIRARSIRILKSQHYQEGEFNSITTGRIAEMVVDIETRGRKLEAGRQVPSQDRIRIEGIKYLLDSEQVVIKYTMAENAQSGLPFSEVHMPFKLEGDIRKLNAAINALSQSCTLYRKVQSSAAPMGFIKPMYYLGEFVNVITALPVNYGLTPE